MVPVQLDGADGDCPPSVSFSKKTDTFRLGDGAGRKQLEAPVAAKAWGKNLVKRWVEAGGAGRRPNSEDVT